MTVTGRKSIIVTGGASGIGLAIARYFAEQGHDITVLDVSVQGEQVVAALGHEFPQSQLTYKRCDVASWEDQASTFKDVFDTHGGKLDIVMANAGISDRGQNNITILDEAGPSKPNPSTVNVNLLGVLYSVKLAAYYMNKKSPSPTTTTNPSRGLIICTASNAGVYPFPVAPVYSASKAGVIGLVRSLARPYAKSHIQINALAPAVLETNIAPDPALFEKMILTPFSTLTRGVAQFVNDPSLTGEIAEIHGDSVTIRSSPEVVDEDSARNLETFWSLGYA